MVKPLMAALRSGRISHAYLFSGPRGCGKTTSARIMARCLNCAEGPTDTPCGKCESCKDLATGGSGSLDVVEIDAASHNGVDDARELRERAGFAPVRDRFKIFILDEAHMVTQQGFNALLKIVEEPPEHVKFIFATTEPDKVIGTIRSRTHHYPFRLVPPETMEKYMAKLCEAENIEPAAGVLQLVMRAGAGSVRDSLSVLDQLMAGAEDGKLAYGTAAALLGYTDSSILERSVDAIIDRDGAALFEVIAKMVEGGHDPRRYLEDLLLRLRDLLVLSVSAPEDAQVALAGTPADQLETMNAQAQRWGTAGISHASDLTNTALTELTGATAPRLQVELLAARLLLPPEQQGSEKQSVVDSGSLTGAEMARAALHRPGSKRPQNVGNEPQAPIAPVVNRTVKTSVEQLQEAPRASVVPSAPRNDHAAPELVAPRPQVAESKHSSPADLKTPVQEQAPRNVETEKGSASAAATVDSSSESEMATVEKGEQYWQVLQAWGKTSARLNEVDPQLWSTCNRHLQIGGAQDQKLTLLADSPRTVEYLKNKLAPLENCLAEELSGSWEVELLPGSDDRFAPDLSELLSRIKLLIPLEAAGEIAEEAPPEEESYPPEPEDFSDNNGSDSELFPGDSGPVSSLEVATDVETSKIESADETVKKVDQLGGRNDSMPSDNNWIIDRDTPKSEGEVIVTTDAGNIESQAEPEDVAPRPGEEMVAPRPTSKQPPKEALQTQEEETLSAPRGENEPVAAPRSQENDANEARLAANVSAAPEFEEDLPDMSDPDASLEESGGTWGVEVAKSLLGGKIIKTVD